MRVSTSMLVRSAEVEIIPGTPTIPPTPDRWIAVEREVSTYTPDRAPVRNPLRAVWTDGSASARPSSPGGPTPQYGASFFKGPAPAGTGGFFRTNGESTSLAPRSDKPTSLVPSSNTPTRLI